MLSLNSNDYLKTNAYGFYSFRIIITSFMISSSRNFVFGISTAAYQIEGAMLQDNKESSIWDNFSHIPGKIYNDDNGDIACNSYNLVDTDIDLIKELGCGAYRFSISWSRIIMSTREVNEKGVLHYNNLIDTLLKSNILPVVTLFHWDLPQFLEDEYEGWLSPQIQTDFLSYADTCFKRFGDRVKTWITINEPWTFVVNGYTTGDFAPGRCSDRSKCKKGNSAIESYQAAHQMLLAHSRAALKYRSDYQFQQNGIIGITLNHDWAFPFTSTQQDRDAAERRNEFAMGWFGDPLFLGDYPMSMKSRVGTRLPTFTPEEKDIVTGSIDFLGLNHYSSKYYYDLEAIHDHKGETNRTSSGWRDDQGVGETKFNINGDLIGPQAASSWLNVVPEGFYNTIMWSSRRYNFPNIFITENGCDIPNESSNEISLRDHLNDHFRIEYLSLYLKEMLRSMHDGANIKGYFAWSLLDNFEWVDGYNMRFGLFRVDFNDPNRKRYPKESAKWYQHYIREWNNNYNKEATKTILPSTFKPSNWFSYLHAAMNNTNGSIIYGFNGAAS